MKELFLKAADVVAIIDKQNGLEGSLEVPLTFIDQIWSFSDVFNTLKCYNCFDEESIQAIHNTQRAPCLEKQHNKTQRTAHVHFENIEVFFSS